MNKFYNICPISLGCEKNRYDLEAALAELMTKGHNIVYDLDNADIIFINTCSFIASARNEAREYIEEAVKAKEKRPKTKIIVSGCYPQKFEKELLDNYGNCIDAYCGIEVYRYIEDIINNIDSYKSNIEAPGKKWSEPKYGRINTQSLYTGNLKIAEGCNNRCSYCAIPSIRGNLRSRPMDLILNEAQNMSSSGIMELNLIAQEITAYGKDIGQKDALPDLIYRLNAITGSLQWIRLLYTYPTEITDRLIKAIKDCDKIVKYIDIPLQHGDSQILKDMNRRGTPEEYLETVQKLREAIPDICIRTTFIVGYPTETDKAFENLVDFVRKAQFDKVGIFPYSREINTPAYNIESNVSDEILQERCVILNDAVSEISIEKDKSFIGRKMKVLCESRDEDYVYGRTERDALEIDNYIKIKTKRNLEGRFVTAQITDADCFCMTGKL